MHVRRTLKPVGRGFFVAGAVAAVAVTAVWGVNQLRDASSTPNAEVPSASPSASPSPSTSAPAAATRARIVASPQPVPILVYHHVTASRGGDQLLYVSRAQFAAELAYLKRYDYQAVTLRAVYDAWTGEGSLPEHPIVISFDDGYADQVRAAAPLLRHYGWPAEIALVFDLLYKGTPAPPSCLTPALVERLLDDGWEIESHTVSHRDLTQLSDADLRHELEYSRKRLRQIFDVPIDFLCYPGGSYDARVKGAAREAGYLAATSTDFAAATPSQLFALPRIYCYWGESLAVFGERLHATLAAARSAGG